MKNKEYFILINLSVEYKLEAIYTALLHNIGTLKKLVEAQDLTTGYYAQENNLEPKNLQPEIRLAQ